ncbi:MAG TPA: TerC family protein [Myxococcales bacterium]|nr:TerC family protein [Myxococcales bacterium]
MTQQDVDTGARNINSPELWAFFLLGVLALLAFDLVISSRRGHGERFREAIGWSVFWIALSVVFGAWLWHRYGGEPGLEFFAGYLLEKSLSVDNLFVFVLLFQSFAVPPEYQHRVLFWGVLGALVLRGALIFAGVTLVHHFRWVVAIFGAILVYTALRIAVHRDEPDRAPIDNPVVRFVRDHLPMVTDIDGPGFFVRRGGRVFATPLLLALVAAETADLVFALDSIPAVFAVTDDSFLVFSSNVCALLGLRALYFVVRGGLVRLRYLKQGLSGILLFVGAKMLLYRWIHLPTGTSLAVIAAILLLAIVVSWLRPAKAD